MSDERTLIALEVRVHSDKHRDAAIAVMRAAGMLMLCNGDIECALHSHNFFLGYKDIPIAPPIEDKR